MQNNDPFLLYITTPTLEIAQELGHSLVESRLCACVNILPEMQAIYRWKEKIESAREAILIAKTTYTCIKSAQELISAQHPYDTPCVLALPISEQGSFLPYLNWIKNESGNIPTTNDETFQS